MEDIPADMPVWRVSWSLAGNVLAVACGEGTVRFHKGGRGGSSVNERVNERE
mgnify:CR=1 FL=1